MSDNQCSEDCGCDAGPNISDDELHSARHMRLTMLADPYRPAYHFVCPEGFAMPFDPNGNIFWKGRHHMGYIYQERGVHYWGHASSRDLIHWRHHKPSLFPTDDSPENGIFSGNGFVDKDGSRVILLYHGCGQGNCLAWSDDANLDNWHKFPFNPIVPNAPDAETADYQSWDPCGWIEGGTYYAVFGGGKNTVWKSEDLEHWEMCGPFLAEAYPGIDIHEDISCPDFFTLDGKGVMVCISHRLGCRYYVGEWKNEQLHPEYHEMMTFADNEYFAPESYTDDMGRRILFTWVFDGRNEEQKAGTGWSGTMGLPRVMELGPDNRLTMTPADELKELRYNGRSFADVAVAADGETHIDFDAVERNVFELEVAFEAVATGEGASGEAGVKVCASADNEEETVIGYDAAEGTLKIDTNRSGIHQGKRSVESAPLKLADGEGLKLRIFVDKSIVEVFANDGRLVLSRRIVPERDDSTGISLYAKGTAAKAASVDVWDMMPTNPY